MSCCTKQTFKRRDTW